MGEPALFSKVETKPIILSVMIKCFFASEPKVILDKGSVASTEENHKILELGSILVFFFSRVVCTMKNRNRKRGFDG